MECVILQIHGRRSRVFVSNLGVRRVTIIDTHNENIQKKSKKTLYFLFVNKQSMTKENEFELTDIYANKLLDEQNTCIQGIFLL
jgi:hypothetical protein